MFLIPRAAAPMGVRLLACLFAIKGEKGEEHRARVQALVHQAQKKRKKERKVRSAIPGSIIV